MFSTVKSCVKKKIKNTIFLFQRSKEFFALELKKNEVKTLSSLPLFIRTCAYHQSPRHSRKNSIPILPYIEEEGPFSPDPSNENSSRFRVDQLKFPFLSFYLILAQHSLFLSLSNISFSPSLCTPELSRECPL